MKLAWRTATVCCVLMLITTVWMVYTTFYVVSQPDVHVVVSDITGNLTGHPGRHLLAAAARLQKQEPSHHVSYIKLEGADSSGNDMFVVYSATVSQLKAICSALPECEGFNSQGWVKSRVVNKRRAAINLYLKQTAIITPQPGEVVKDHSAGLFQRHLDDYDAMEHDLKIYVYETSTGLNMPSYDDYKYGVEHLFISLLAKSKFRTRDPSKATLFFIPSRCTAYRKSVPDLGSGIRKAAETTRRMLEEIRRNYPYWNASLGADHFYICAHDMGTEVAKLADFNLWKNAIGLVNTADYLEPAFIPHKDISLPPHPGRGTVDWAEIGQGGAAFDPIVRTKLAFMAGHPARGPVRPKIYEKFGQDPDFHLVQGYISDAEYMRALKTTKFCLCPRGNKAWSPRLMDALWFGCIPVIIADHYVPPLGDLVEWESIAVSVAEKQVSDLKRILLSLPDQRVWEMQTNIQKVYHQLTWHSPPLPYDAFHAVLFELWQKRNVRRTHLKMLPVDSVAYPLV